MSTAQESINLQKTTSKSWIRNFLLKEYEFFEHSLTLKSRILILLAVLVLLPAFIFPLWQMTFFSNQYTDGLRLTIYTYQLEGAKTPARDDLREINSLNHYIGMRPLLESEFSEIIWLPFAIGGLVILALRAMVMGKMSKLVDVFALFTWFGLYSFWSFYHRLYTYGHNLDPQAPITVEPFTPPLLGKAIVGNFTVYSYPDIASYSLIAFGLLLAVAIWFSRKNSEV
jgi:copper chaperone NosL